LPGTIARSRRLREHAEALGPTFSKSFLGEPVRVTFRVYSAEGIPRRRGRLLSFTGRTRRAEAILRIAESEDVKVYTGGPPADC
jgi:hypothetical protein